MVLEERIERIVTLGHRRNLFCLLLGGKKGGEL